MNELLICEKCKEEVTIHTTEEVYCRYYSECMCSCGSGDACPYYYDKVIDKVLPRKDKLILLKEMNAEEVRLRDRAKQAEEEVSAAHPYPSDKLHD